MVNSEHLSVNDHHSRMNGSGGLANDSGGMVNGSGGLANNLGGKVNGLGGMVNGEHSRVNGHHSRMNGSGGLANAQHSSRLRPDLVVLDFARQHKRLVLTRNCDDFHKLHQTNPAHSRILVIYQDSDPTKNMNYQKIVKAIAISIARSQR